MNQKDQTPSNTPDPQWDDLVARLQQGDATDATVHPASPDARPENDPAKPTNTPEPRQGLLPGETSEPPAIPHEPTAAEREARLRKLFNTGPLARGPRDYEVDPHESLSDFTAPEPPALGYGDPTLTLSWVATAAGLLGLLFCVIFMRDAPSLLYAVLAIISLVGVIMLLRRLPKDRDPGDDGARV